MFFQHCSTNGCEHFKTHKTAIDSTGTTVCPESAANGRYSCASCHQEVLLKSNSAHFSHTASTTCAYLNRDWSSQPESVLHKTCKELLKRRLEEGVHLSVKCKQCEHQLFSYQKEVGDVVTLEHSGSSWVADVAVSRNGSLYVILEVRVTHSTTNPRPEPWYEFVAKDMYPTLVAGTELSLVCCREQPYNRCTNCSIIVSNKDNSRYYGPRPEWRFTESELKYSFPYGKNLTWEDYLLCFKAKDENWTDWIKSTIVAYEEENKSREIADFKIQQAKKVPLCNIAKCGKCRSRGRVHVKDGLYATCSCVGGDCLTTDLHVYF